MNPEQVYSKLVEALRRTNPTLARFHLTPVWGGYTSRPFPPVVGPDSKPRVLRKSLRLDSQGLAAWYELEVLEKEKSGHLYLALEFVA